VPNADNKAQASPTIIDVDTSVTYPVPTAPSFQA